jgi:hypothetical protein
MKLSELPLPIDTLNRAQRWLLEAITARREPSAADLDRFISAGPQQSAAERLAIYRRAYLARLLEVLRELFPCTRFTVGDELFEQLMTDYLEMCPPQSYTLAHLADRLPGHLEATRPADWGEFIVEVVRLEQAIDQVFDAPGGECLPPFALPSELNGSLRLVLIPGSRLLAFNYPVSGYYTAWKAGSKPRWPEPELQYVALLRRDFIVRRYELSGPQFHILAALQAGKSLDESLAAIEPTADLQCLAPQVEQWFADWAAECFFASVL